MILSESSFKTYADSSAELAEYTPSIQGHVFIPGINAEIPVMIKDGQKHIFSILDGKQNLFSEGWQSRQASKLLKYKARAEGFERLLVPEAIFSSGKHVFGVLPFYDLPNYSDYLYAQKGQGFEEKLNMALEYCLAIKDLREIGFLSQDISLINILYDKRKAKSRLIDIEDFIEPQDVTYEDQTTIVKALAAKISFIFEEGTFSNKNYINSFLNRASKDNSMSVDKLLKFFQGF